MENPGMTWNGSGCRRISRVEWGVQSQTQLWGSAVPSGPRAETQFRAWRRTQHLLCRNLCIWKAYGTVTQCGQQGQWQECGHRELFPVSICSCLYKPPPFLCAEELLLPVNREDFVPAAQSRAGRGAGEPSVQIWFLGRCLPLPAPHIPEGSKTCVHSGLLWRSFATLPFRDKYLYKYIYFRIVLKFFNCQSHVGILEDSHIT